MRKLYCLLFSFLLPVLLFSQSRQNLTSAEIYQGIKKLNVLGSVLYVAAHPDDENTRLITYLSKDKLYRAGYLSLTRGDGGQNLVGEEQGIELGLIRTQELLAARRIDGGEQFFTRAFDFGYSKTPEETFIKWDKEKILSDVVWVIRKFQPDVIVTRFPTTGEGGHGHHTASAILANEAFEAAADANRFPEQFKYGVKPWQAKRVLWNTFSFGGNNTTRPDQFKTDVGGYNALLGKSYGEIAAEGRSQHKSQGFGSAASRGETLEYFKAIKGDQPVNDLLDGVDISWGRVEGGKQMAVIIEDILNTFNLLHPEKSVNGLINLYKALQTLPAGNWRSQKLNEVQQLIMQCSGLFMDATTAVQYAAQTDSLKINFVFNNRLGAEAVLAGVLVDKFDTTFNRQMEKNRNISFSKTFYVPAAKPISQPFWLQHEMAEGYYNIAEQEKIGQADADPAYVATVLVKIDGEPISFPVPVRYKYTDPVKGEVYQPLVVMPPVEFDFVDENNLSVNDTAVRSQLHFVSLLKDSVLYKVAFKYSDKWYAERPEFNYGTWRNSENYASPVFKPAKKGNTLSEAVSIEVSRGKDIIYAGKRKVVAYDHIPSQVYFKKAKTNLLQIDLKTYNKKIGYITGAGDKVPDALEQMGYEVIQLGDKELLRNNLQQYDAIITGVRAYNTHEWMNKHYDKLMKYVSDGGNLIVQYNTSNQIGPVRAKIGPYNFNITRNRVTDETAAVTLLKPEHPVFNFPNKITQDDFKGWVQERSIYHATDTSGKFEKLIAMADPTEKSDDGSLLVTKYGKGWFTYTGLVFFRQLPAGVPGAYRLLANIIALNKKKGF